MAPPADRDDEWFGWFVPPPCEGAWPVEARRAFADAGATCCGHRPERSFVAVLDAAASEPFLEAAARRGDLCLAVTMDPDRVGLLLDRGATDVVVWPRDRAILGARLRRVQKEATRAREEVALRARLGQWGAHENADEQRTFGGRLIQQLRLLRAMLDANPDPIFVLDKEERLLLVNASLARIQGVSPASLIGKALRSLEGWQDLAPSSSRSPDGAGTLDVQELEVVDAAGEARVYVATRCLLGGSGEGRLLVVTHDVTALRRAEAAANAARAKAVAASEVKTRFLANMSHEIRTPMNAVLGMTSLALDTQLDSEQREYLEAVQSAGQSLLVIINDILDISKIEAGKLTIEEVEFELRPTLRQALQPLQFRTRQKGLALDVSVDPDVADTVIGDPVRVRQILVNLVSNALKFTERGGIAIRVMRDPDDESLVRVAVTDSGIGIPAEKQRLIFEPFLQADDSTTRHFGGTGLGLTICRELTGLMGGRIWVESEPGKGSTFWFTARLVNSGFWFTEEPETPRQEAPSGPKLGAAPVVPLRVLLAEDNPTNTKLGMRLLEKAGCIATHAENGAAAVLAFQEGTFDLILMDMQMPVMDGLEATRRIRALEAPRGTRILIAALTANAMKSDEEACRVAGMDAFLTKPVERAALSQLIERARGLARASVTSLPNAGAVSPDDVDLKALLDQCDGDGELFGDLVTTFRDTWQETLQALRGALEARDATAVLHASHRLKGSARALHAPRVAEMSGAMEQASRKGDLAFVAQELDALRSTLERLDRLLAQPFAALLASAQAA